MAYISSLGIETLRDHLSVREIPSSGNKKLELVARVFLAAEMGLPIIMSCDNPFGCPNH